MEVLTSKLLKKKKNEINTKLSPIFMFKLDQVKL